MESKLASLGSSMKVPNVQELAKQKISSVPSRYIRPNHHHHHHHNPPSTLSQIPEIDMHNLFHPNFINSELHKLHTACKEWGFFQLINHGVNPSVIDAMKLELEGFFNLPIEEKNKFSQEAGDVEGYGQSFVVSHEQKLDWADAFFVVTSPDYSRKPHLIPKLPSQFRNAIEAYSQELKDVATKILRLMEKALGMKSEEIMTLFEEGRQSMRMNYYPPCPQPELVTGLYPHSDVGGLTILLQANEVEGLQIKKDGILSNGIYRSVEHRATVNAEKERISVATFFSPKLDGEIGPSASLVSPDKPAKFKRISYAEILRGYLSKELDGKSYLETMRL